MCKGRSRSCNQFYLGSRWLCLHFRCTLKTQVRRAPSVVASKRAPLAVSKPDVLFCIGRDCSFPFGVEQGSVCQFLSRNARVDQLRLFGCSCPKPLVRCLDAATEQVLNPSTRPPLLQFARPPQSISRPNYDNCGFKLMARFGYQRSNYFFGGIMRVLFNPPMQAAVVGVFYLATGLCLDGQSGGNSGSIAGTVSDPTGRSFPAPR